jgi:N-acetylglutamate synthase-like GNAT family acetyltransferase
MITRVADEVALASTGAGSAGSAGCGGRAADAQQEVVLRDGLRVVVRPLDAGDEAAIVSWFAGLGAETRYARFLAPLERLDRRTRSELARVDHFDHEAIAAVAPDGTTVGIARYIRIARRRSAEVAVAVADDWRGRGIASMLLDRVAARARAAGVEQLTAICLATNYTVIRLLSRLGPTTVGPSDAGLVDVRIDLMSTRPDRSPSRAASDGRRD